MKRLINNKHSLGLLFGLALLFFLLGIALHVQAPIYAQTLDDSWGIYLKDQKVLLNRDNTLLIRVLEKGTWRLAKGYIKINGQKYTLKEGAVLFKIKPETEELTIDVGAYDFQDQLRGKERFYVTAQRDFKAAVLMYHHLAPAGAVDFGKWPIITPEAFEEQMKFLVDNGYHVISLKDLYQAVAGIKSLPSKPVVITFDDGYESNYIYAYPILKKYNLKATINIIVKETPAHTSPVFNPSVLTHLSWEQMREMVDSGLIDIQSHTYDSHKFLPLNASGSRSDKALVSRVYLPQEKRVETKEEYLARVEHDLRTAKELIESNLQREVHTICYPYGAYNQDVITIAKNLGYKMGLTVRNGYMQMNEDLMTIERVNISNRDTLEDFKKKLSWVY